MSAEALRDVTSLPITRYTPRDQSGTVLASCRRACGDVHAARWVIWQLFVRDYVSQYRQKLFGYCWAAITPLIGVFSFIFLHYTGILRPGRLEVPYPLYVFFGTTLWTTFLATVDGVSSGLIKHGDLIKRTNVPKFGLAVAGVVNIAYALLISAVTLCILLIVFRVMPSWGALLYPILLLPMMALGIGLGLVLVLGAVAGDVTKACMALLGLAMFATPVVYSRDTDNQVLRTIMQWNPLTYLIDVPRTVFFTGTTNDWGPYLAVSCGTVVFLMLSVHVFYLVSDKSVERL